MSTARATRPRGYPGSLSRGPVMLRPDVQQPRPVGGRIVDTPPTAAQHSIAAARAIGATNPRLCKFPRTLDSAPRRCTGSSPCPRRRLCDRPNCKSSGIHPRAIPIPRRDTALYPSASYPDRLRYGVGQYIGYPIAPASRMSPALPVCPAYPTSGRIRGGLFWEGDFKIERSTALKRHHRSGQTIGAGEFALQNLLESLGDKRILRQQLCYPRIVHAPSVP